MAQWQLLASSLIGAVTIAVGISQFQEDSLRRDRIAQFEARKPFLVKQMEMCFLASEAASTLASSTSPENWQLAREKFWNLYWGPLSIVETPLQGTETGRVEQRMVQFGDKLKPLQDNPSLPLDSLEQESLNIAHECRDLIIDSWGVERAG